MTNFLKDILAKKHEHVALLKQSQGDLFYEPAMQHAERQSGKKSFEHALKKPGLSVIAEIKRHSPSRGMLAQIVDPCDKAQDYVSGGADAISILTEHSFFHGAAQDLQAVRAVMPSFPLLRKDFVVDPFELYESAAMGASAVLLIVAVLGERLREFLRLAHELSLETLVEVHTEAELEIAVEAGSPIIGINNRNLTTFDVDIETGVELNQKIPAGVVTVAESGIVTLDDARHCYEAGFDAVLVGEALVCAHDPAVLLHAFKEID